MKTKSGISLIVLVLTVIVLSIIATAVIITLSNTNIMSEASKTVGDYTVGQMKEAVEMAKDSIMLGNNADITGINDPIKITKKMVEQSSITEEQRSSMLQKGSYYDGKYIGIEGTEIVDYTGLNVMTGDDYKIEDGKGKIRFEFTFYPKYGITADCVTGYICASEAYMETLTDTTYEDALTLENEGNYAKIFSGTVANKNKVKNDDGSYKCTCSFIEMTESMADKRLVVRMYVKFNYTDENGNVVEDCIVYSPIAVASYNEAAANTK